MMHFSKEFLEKYSAATYVAILAASEEAYRTGWIAPDKDEDPRKHVSANTAAATAGSGADTAAREQTTMGEGAANNNSESNQSAPAGHAVLEPDKQQSQSRTVPAEGPWLSPQVALLLTFSLSFEATNSCAHTTKFSKNKSHVSWNVVTKLAQTVVKTRRHEI